METPMLAEPVWSQVRNAMSNFPVMVGGVMMIAASRAAAGHDPASPVVEAGTQIRSLIADRLGKSPLDEATAQRVRAELSESDASELIAACAEFAQGLRPLSEELEESDMLAYIQRGGPGEDGFDRFMQRFMPMAQRIQRIVVAGVFQPRS